MAIANYDYFLKKDTPLRKDFKFIFLFIQQDLAKQSGLFHPLIIQSINATSHIFENNRYMLLMTVVLFFFYGISVQPFSNY